MLTQASIFRNLSEKDAVPIIGELCKKDMQTSGILASISAAQFILESGYGTTELAQNANNCFGMKANLSGNTWTGSTWDGTSIYTKKTKEEYKPGVITVITADFRKYSCVEHSVADHSAYLLGAKKGTGLRYAGLKGETDYKKAITIIKNGGYATDSRYIEKICNIIERWNLTRFDIKEEKYMTISELSVYNNITENKSYVRPGGITRITPHCYVGQVTAEQGVDYLAGKDGASVNYVVDKDGKVGCNIPEELGAWTSSSINNDNQAITMELACDTTYPYAMNDSCIAGFIELVVDICKRYNRNKVVYIADKNEALAYNVAENEFLITFHRWFAATACPGQWFLDNVQGIVDRINDKLEDKPEPVENPTVNETKYTVQLGAYSVLDNANRHASSVPGSIVCVVDDLYKVFVGSGTKVEMTVLKNESYSNGFVTVLPDNASIQLPIEEAPLKVGDIVTLDRDATVYNSDRRFASWVYDSQLYVRRIDGDRVVVSIYSEGDVTGAVDIKYIVR